MPRSWVCWRPPGSQEAGSEAVRHAGMQFHRSAQKLGLKIIHGAVSSLLCKAKDALPSPRWLSPHRLAEPWSQGNRLKDLEDFIEFIYFFLFLSAFPHSAPFNERKFCKIQLQRQTTGKGRGRELTDVENCTLWAFCTD